ncbi:DUF4864 domain-containing protein [Salinarimonas soli]|uniref:DUF4864 domain-containing protein n=1 Tax=Salinarimonas soli TaxID=1638099 RepID=A0A5B2VFX6_9HYPH|nr:DUF4864 domain-containing protein [Salinarimonas soli]KAA2237884.1 DUF4864 domain-containing protein [Salinarimonas soli]
MRHVLPRLLLALSLFGPLPAWAADEADGASVRTVIERQLDAFARDDAAGAYAHAAPVIREAFPTDGVFMSMVRRGYPPVYRARRHSFADLRELPGGGLEQSVRIEDEAGEDWLAVYTMEKQPDGTWQISGCRLERVASQAA